MAREITFIVTGGSGCACCSGCCGDTDIDDLLYPNARNFGIVVAFVRPDPDPKPDPDFHRHKACLRWVCGEVSESELVSAVQIGGPTTSGLDLVALLPGLVTLPDDGCYLWAFEFWGWRKGSTLETPAQWISDDTMYRVKEDLL